MPGETIAIVNWNEQDALAAAIACELEKLGHRPAHFRFDEPVPAGAGIVLTFAPYGRLLPVLGQLTALPAGQRPFFVHWNTESIPNLDIPWPIIRAAGSLRSCLDRQNEARSQWKAILFQNPPLSWANGRMIRFRLIGDYCYAYRKGWLDLLCDISEMYADLYSRHGLPAVAVPWGTPPDWYAGLDLDRDIDVLWLGKRRNARRSGLIDQVQSQLATHGAQMVIVDGVETPFIYGPERTRILNRTKIVLNINTVWSDNVFYFRFHMAAGNRCLVVSESFIPQHPAYREGMHYVAAPAEALAETILHYLEHNRDRQRIADNAYQLVTTELTLGNSVKALMETVERMRPTA